MPGSGGSFRGETSVPQPESALGVAVGTVVASKYRVDRVIGKGGMGVVVAATQLALDRMVAIKLIRSEAAADPLAVERLLREAKAAASIRSEHVARVLDVGTLDDGAPFIVMEYLEGDDLQTVLDQDGPLSEPDAVDFILQACEAIAEAHRNGIVHRDIKPANLILARLPGGMSSVKVVDFGISKSIWPSAVEPLTQPSSVVGSLYHMSPEQMRGGPVDARTDVWALGLLLFEMVTGGKPFRDQAWPAVCAQVLYEGTPILELPVEGMSEGLALVIQKCLRRLPDDRYDNIAELAVGLSPFGTRRAHLSLERIVLLATSTGSLSAQALPAAPSEPTGEPALPFDKTRPVPTPSAPAPSAPSPGTPPPVSSVRAQVVSRPYVQLALGVATGLCVVIPALLWLLPARDGDAKGDHGADPAPLVIPPPGEEAPAAAVPSAEPGPIEQPAGAAGGRPTPKIEPWRGPPGESPEPKEEKAGSLEPSGVAAPAPEGPARPPNEAARGTPPPSSSSGSSSARPGNGAPNGPPPEGSAPPAKGPAASGEANAAAPENPGAGGRATTPAAEGAGGSSPRAEPPRTIEAPKPPPNKARTSPASPWDLHDIEFEDDEERR